MTSRPCGIVKPESKFDTTDFMMFSLILYSGTICSYLRPTSSTDLPAHA